MEIKRIKIDDIIPYENNAKEHPKEQIEQIKNSILQFGNNDPIAIDENNIIIEGHGRYIALKELGYNETEVIILTGLTEDQKNAYRIVHNQLTMNSGWDMNKLKEELSRIEGIDLSELGIDESMLDEIEEKYDEAESGTLSKNFIVPPFSILDTRQGYWQERKKVWKQYIKSDEGRDEALLGKGLLDLANKQAGNNNLTGTSIFDPLLCEILYNWFCPPNAKVLDPFAGGSVRGLVASFLGLNYTGVDLSKRQIEANYSNYNSLDGILDFNGNELKKPNWINADSLTIDEIINDRFDFLLTCPPYADLEVYSDDERDISNMPYEKFIDVYSKILSKAVAKLNDNAFAAIVVGEVRDKKGYYRGFVSDTIDIMEQAGTHFYNDCILVEQIATAALRAGKQFTAKRKVVKTHQNVLIFVKGDENQIMKSLKPYEYDFTEELPDE